MEGRQDQEWMQENQGDLPYLLHQAEQNWVSVFFTHTSGLSFKVGKSSHFHPPPYDLTSSAVLSVMLRSVMSNLHCKRTTWQQRIKNGFSRNKGGSKEAVKVAFLGETC